MTLWEEITLKKYHKYQGQYQEDANKINKIAIPGLTRIQEIQIRNLKKGHVSKEAVNNFFKSINKKQANHENYLPKTLNKMSARLVQIINQGIDKDFGKKQQQDNKGERLTSEAIQLLEQLKVSEPMKKQYIELLNSRLEKIEVGKDDAGEEYIRKYVQRKAALIEKLAVDIMNSTPGVWEYLQTIQTGNIMDWGGKQFVEDAVSISPSHQFKNGGISVGVKMGHGSEANRKNMTIYSAKGLMQLLDTVNKKDYTIRLDDEAYDLLQKASSIKIQVKSGKNQPLFTQAARNLVTLKQFNFFVEANARPLEKIYNNIDNYPPLKKTAQSQKLDLLANYTLAKRINETVLGRNDLYFTDKGFITAEEYLKEYKKILLFSRGIKQLSSTFLSESRAYSIKDLQKQMFKYK